MTSDREQFDVETAQHVAIGFDVAGLGDRFVAALIDYAILGAYVLGLALVLGGLASVDVVGGLWAIGLYLLSFVPALVYFPFCELVFDGQSIGKRVQGLRVIRTSGAEPTLGDLLLRWLLRPIDLWATSGLAAVTTILYTGTGQRLGDLAAGTTVVEVRRRATLDETLFVDLDEDYTPTFTGAAALSQEDVTTARRVLQRLEQANGQADDAPAHQLATRTQQALLRKMDTSTDLAPQPFLETVLQDYNYYQRR